jgi:hypothetical protein
MRPPFEQPVLRLRLVDRPTLSGAGIVVDIEDDDHRLLGTVTQRWPHAGDRAATFDVLDVRGRTVASLQRPSRISPDGRRLWIVGTPKDHDRMAVSVLSLPFSEKLSVRVLPYAATTAATGAEDALARMQVGKLLGTWNIVTAAGEAAPMTPMAGGARGARRLDLTHVAEERRLDALAGALVGLLVHCLPVKAPAPAAVRGPRFGRATQWVPFLDC